MFSSEVDQNGALVSPLLRSDEGLGGNSNIIMETSTASDEAHEHNRTMTNQSRRALLYRFAAIPTLADSLPHVFQLITNSGKYSGLVFLAVYLVFILLWLPFWAFTFFVGEFGVYVTLVTSIFYLGRVIIRMIAFPGASNKVVSEVESEFAKYSVRMLVAAANCLRELATALTATGMSRSETSAAGSSGNLSYYEIPPIWKRAKSYRDRAIGVYLEVLTYIYEQPSQVPTQPGNLRTQFGTNSIVGDIGNLNGLTPQAREDGKELVRLLKTLVSQMNQLESQASPVLNGNIGAQSTISEEARATATQLLSSANELRDFVTSLKPPSADDNASGSDEDITVDAMRRRVEEQSASAMDAVKSGLSSILPMMDPPPHTSIFGFDVLRGTVLSRYIGSRQLWVQRPGGGMLDVLHIPTKNRPPNSAQNPKAVMYCNPNAGLCEVATGMSLAGGNIGEDDVASQDCCWTDFYTELGFDIYVFNYAGFGRSYGTTMCVTANTANEDFVPGVLGRLKRIFRACFLTFKPTPDTLREDGVALANYITRELGVEKLVIHGESIGGVAASRSAQRLSLSPSTRDKLSLLICDRTFCNLEAVAQRLVGNWSGYAIRSLAPLWNTDVAGDFLTAQCPKVVANDFADAIVADSSSLKTGVSLWKEIQRGMSTTKGIGWVMETPVEYRMADWENVCVIESQYVTATGAGSRAPVWPQDKHVSLSEAFHFAACVKRIGRRSKQESGSRSAESDEDGIELGRGIGGQSSPLRSAWETLACCDGLCGAPLGVAVKVGFDTTIAWLCCCLTYGGQYVVEEAEHRLAADGGQPNSGSIAVVPADFDMRPAGFEMQESAKLVHPKPIPEVLESLKVLVADNGDAFASVKHEITFVIGMLEYMLARLSSPQAVQSSWNCRHGKQDESMVGCFLNLHCGHNNPFAKSERDQLRRILQETAG